MTQRKQTTKILTETLLKKITHESDSRKYFATEVTFDYGTPKQCRVDVMEFRPKNNTVSGIEKGDFYCYEVKSCVADFKSTHGHNFIGDYNYYVMPKELYEEVQGSIAYSVGVIVSDMNGNLITQKRARRVDRTKSIAEMLLMMFRSANRENIKGGKWR
jgi:hypothetical protein